MLRKYGLELVDLDRKFKPAGKPFSTSQPVTDPDLCDKYSQQMDSTALHPYALVVALPKRLGSLNFDDSLLQGRAVVNLPDQEGFFAQPDDVVPVKQSEWAQLLVLSQMNANCTAVESTVITRLFSKLAITSSVEHLRREVTQTLDFLSERASDRRVLAASLLTLATLVPRRDLMLRSGLPPDDHLGLFANDQASASPLPVPADTAICENAWAQQLYPTEVTREVRRRHADEMFNNSVCLSTKGQRCREDYFCEEREAREQRAKESQLKFMTHVMRQIHRDQELESELSLLQNNLNDKRAAERKKAHKEEMARLRNRPVTDFDDWQERRLVDALRESREKAKRDKSLTSTATKTTIVRAFDTSQSQTVKHHDASVCVSVPRPTPAAARSPPATDRPVATVAPARPKDPVPVESSVQNWYMYPEFRNQIKIQLSRSFNAPTDALYAAAEDAQRRYDAIVDASRKAESDSDRAALLDLCVLLYTKVRPHRIDDEQRDAHDCFIRCTPIVVRTIHRTPEGVDKFIAHVSRVIYPFMKILQQREEQRERDFQRRVTQRQVEPATSTPNVVSTKPPSDRSASEPAPPRPRHTAPAPPSSTTLPPSRPSVAPTRLPVARATASTRHGPVTRSTTRATRPPPPPSSHPRIVRLPRPYFPRTAVQPRAPVYPTPPPAQRRPLFQLSAEQRLRSMTPTIVTPGNRRAASPASTSTRRPTARMSTYSRPIRQPQRPATTSTESTSDSGPRVEVKTETIDLTSSQESL